MRISSTSAVNSFKCLQSDCPDTCCKGWSMQLDDFTFEKYKGTSLEAAVSYDGTVRVMKRDPKTDYCVKFEGSVCSVHKEKGVEYLGDACNFYPRVTRNLGAETIMTLTPSCPEALRLMLEDGAEDYFGTEAERLPATLKDWLEDGISVGDGMKMHQRFLAECKADASAAKIMARIYSASNSLEYLDKKDWADATDFMLRMADGKMLPPEPQMMDEYNVLQVFLGVMHATGKGRSVRLDAVLDAIAIYLNIDIDYATLLINPKGAKKKTATGHDAVLKKYIAAQISFSTYPFAGIGADIKEKAKILAFKFALARLALDAWSGNAVDCLQPISRIIDHIADGALMLQLMNGFGWKSEGRVMGLIQK